jgi:hypothetical protein
MLSAFGPNRELLWHIDLAAASRARKQWLPYFGVSLPTVLQDGSTLMVMRYGILLVPADGSTVEVFREDLNLDDSGMSPNLTLDGRPLISSILGEVFILSGGRWLPIGERGYGFDILCPAVYDDGSLAIAGYAGTGFCRVALDGAIHWQSNLRDADGLPTVHPSQVAAVGSLNDGLSMFFAANGSVLGRYPYPATFAVYNDGWVALSKHHVARLTADGQELWGRTISMQRPCASVVQPIVDVDGYIYIRHDAGMLCLDGDGQTLFELSLPTTNPDPLSLIAPGVLASVADNKLLIAEL